MKASIDRLGRVVVPKRIRDKLQLQGGETLEVEERDGMIELRPVPTKVDDRRDAAGARRAPLEQLPALTDELVRDALEQVRR